METTILQWIGYIASIIIALSMTMNSIVKFRWINLAGAITFSTYGFLIGAMPVGFLNGFIVCVDIYYLVIIYTKKEIFEILEVKPDNRYLLRFLKFHDKDIQKFFPGFEYKPEINTISFFIHRNMAVAGLFLAHKSEDGILKVGLDYVIPEYRDFKNAKFVYHRLSNRFIEAGFKQVITKGKSKHHIKYLKKLGFFEDKDGCFVKNFESNNRKRD
ncbi:MAG: hypothetical protein A2W99_08050 [Bacteroidetes bacterium GWF2_33_16]|nr:MAG: hypothetical protein A2X00_08395 [Bacteroidetes bacterium GWE2_32_14]OFY02242.1 MAG: hypothetical protein A2W99_08050 [Bacteroidetes bacterium GWF2_33_16]